MSKKEHLIVFCDLLKKLLEQDKLSEDRIEEIYNLIIGKIENQKLDSRTIQALFIGNLILNKYSC